MTFDCKTHWSAKIPFILLASQVSISIPQLDNIISFKLLFMAGLHGLIGEPAEPFAQAVGRNACHHDLRWVG
jgi:hypothetical protein